MEIIEGIWYNETIDSRKKVLIMKETILKILRETDGYVSGQKLCELLGVSRTAVWKAINQLREEGYEIDSVNNKGYQLNHVPDVMSEAEILSQLETNWLGHPLYYFDSIDSTNNYAKKLAEEGAGHGTVVIGDQQTAGKGRLGRSWNSPRGCAVYISYLLRPDILPVHASQLTIVAALATAKAVEEVTGLDCGIKWPNDIVVDGRKVCGILTEMTADMDQVHYVVIGIGVNVNMTEFDEAIRDTATSLRLKTGEMVSRASIILSMLRYFEKYYENFLEHEDLSGILEEYNSRLVNRNRQVRILERRGEWTAIARSMNAQGELVVETEDGKQHNILSGEVSVRGIYGYV